MKINISKAKNRGINSPPTGAGTPTDNSPYINVAPTSARGLRSPFVRQTCAVIR
jgi:hypothetical protein